LPRKVKLFSKTPSTPVTSIVDSSSKQQVTTNSDKIVNSAKVKPVINSNEENFELNSEVKKLEHITKNRPKRDRNKKPRNGTVSNQKIETVELNEDLVVIEKTDEPVITVIQQPVAPTKPTTPSNCEPPSTPKTPMIPKPNAEQPIVSIDALERIKLRATVKKPNESKDAESTPTVTVSQADNNNVGVPGMIKQNKLRYSCYAGSASGKSPALLSAHQVNTIAEDDSAPVSNELKLNKIPPVKPPKPQAPPKPNLAPSNSTTSSQQQDNSQIEQAPTPFVRLRPVSKPAVAVVPQADSPGQPAAIATTNSETNKTDQDKRQSLSVKERIQFLSEESKVRNETNSLIIYFSLFVHIKKFKF
jgi:hypothetical protein